MERHFLAIAVVLGLFAAFVVMPRLADAQNDQAGTSAVARDSDPVSVFQSAGPTAASI